MENRVDLPEIDLERELKTDKSGTCLDAVIRTLSHHLIAVKGAIDSGATPERFADLEKIKESLETSKRFAEQTLRYLSERYGTE
ncbi:hypothetical protein TRIP_B200802 [uncultured Desulfatiglans sp.]|uniref:Uncharacterized protein n=1 Tax=Uncultured Desulfatiglans sp. TaxID=1748965 RepID=A0A653A4S6_UNCDX|nr:hypothetical protein TRIP_B200802 [uncultured Desulfatiglans sp.]